MTNATTDPNEDRITTAARAGAAYALLATKAAVHAGVATTSIIPGMIRLGIDDDLERFAAIAEVMMEVAFAELPALGDAVSMIGSIEEEVAARPKFMMMSGRMVETMTSLSMNQSLSGKPRTPSPTEARRAATSRTA